MSLKKLKITRNALGIAAGMVLGLGLLSAFAVSVNQQQHRLVESRSMHTRRIMSPDGTRIYLTGGLGPNAPLYAGWYYWYVLPQTTSHGTT